MEPIPRLGKRIQALREEKGLSIQKLAERSGTSYQNIWRIEHGQQLDPSVALMRGIARGLGVGVDHVIEMFGMHDKESDLVDAGALTRHTYAQVREADATRQELFGGPWAEGQPTRRQPSIAHRKHDPETTKPPQDQGGGLA